jgi:hypothetical protein
MPTMGRRLIVVGAATFVFALAGVGHADSAWHLTGRWQAASGNTLMLTQTGSTVKWVARSATKAWVHDFTGKISGDTISGGFQDRAGFSVHNRGSLTVRIVDDCHIVGTQLTINDGPPTNSGEHFVKTPCVKDTVVPKVKVFPAHGRHGEPTTLRFRVSDNSGEADIVVALWQGNKRLSRHDYGFRKVDGRTLTITITPGAKHVGVLELWVIAADRAGNRLASHAAVTIA